MIFSTGELRELLTEGRCLCRQSRALISDLIEARDELDRRNTRAPAIAALKKDLDELEAFRLEYGVLAEPLAGAQVLRVATAVQRDLIEAKRRIADLEDG